MALTGEKGELVGDTGQSPFGSQQDVEVISWPTRTHTFSQGIPIFSGRGLSQVLPDNLQAELQHAIIISPGTSGLGDAEPPIEVEPQVDVITMESESYEQESEPEYNDLGEQIPDEEVAVGAMEVTVCTEDQETPTETEDLDMINQSSSKLGDPAYEGNSDAPQEKFQEGENHTSELASPPSAVVREVPSEMPQVSQNIEVSSYPVLMEHAGNVPPGNVGDEHVVFSSDTMGGVEVSTMVSDQETESASNLPPTSLGTASERNRPAEVLEDMASLSVSSGSAIPVRQRGRQKKVVVIPAEEDAALHSFSQDDILTRRRDRQARNDNVETVKEAELPGVQEDDVIVAQDNGFPVQDDSLPVVQQKEDDRAAVKNTTAKNNGVPTTRKRAIVVPIEMDGSLQCFSQDEVGIRREPLPQIQQFSEEGVVAVTDKVTQPDNEPSGTQISTQSSHHSSKSLFSSCDLPASQPESQGSLPAPVSLHNLPHSRSPSTSADPLPSHPAISLKSVPVTISSPTTASTFETAVSVPKSPVPLRNHPAAISTVRKHVTSLLASPARPRNGQVSADVGISVPAAPAEDDFLYHTDSEAVCSDSDVRLESPSSSQHVHMEEEEEGAGPGEQDGEEEESEEELEFEYPVSSMVISKQPTPCPDLTTKPYPSVMPTTKLVMPTTTIEASPAVDISPLVLPSPLPVILPPFLRKSSVFRELICSAAWGKATTDLRNHHKRLRTPPDVTLPLPATSQPCVDEEVERESPVVAGQDGEMASSPDRDMEDMGRDTFDLVIDAGREPESEGVVSAVEEGDAGGAVSAEGEDVGGVVSAEEEGGVDVGGVVSAEEEGGVDVRGVVSAEGGGTDVGPEGGVGPERGVISDEESQGMVYTGSVEEVGGLDSEVVSDKEEVPTFNSESDKERDAEAEGAEQEESADSNLPDTLIVDVVGSQSPIWGQVVEIDNTQGDDLPLGDVVDLGTPQKTLPPLLTGLQPPTPDSLRPPKEKRVKLAKGYDPTDVASPQRSHTPSRCSLLPPKEKRLKLDRHLAPKDATSELTMGTPHYSQDAFQAPLEGLCTASARESTKTPSSQLQILGTCPEPTVIHPSGSSPIPVVSTVTSHSQQAPPTTILSPPPQPVATSRPPPKSAHPPTKSPRSVHPPSKLPLPEPVATPSDHLATLQPEPVTTNTTVIDLCTPEDMISIDLTTQSEPATTPPLSISPLPPESVTTPHSPAQPTASPVMPVSIIKIVHSHYMGIAMRTKTCKGRLISHFLHGQELNTEL